MSNKSYARWSWEWIKETIKAPFHAECSQPAVIIFYTPKKYIGFIKGIAYLYFPSSWYVLVKEDNQVKGKTYHETYN